MGKSKYLLPKFMIAENPMSEFGVEYVIHTQEPRFIAKKVEGNPSTDFEIVDEIDDMAKFYQNNPTRIAGLMRRLGDWWISYIKWEEDNYEK